MSKLEFEAAGITRAGTNVCTLADELSAVRRTWNKATTEVHGDPFGFAEVEKAFTGMRETWSQELDVYVTILEQVCGKLQRSGKTHGDAERANVSSVQRMAH
jgi:hypothetical protein